MDKDLIIKLAKLANNNPNENEANAAARKVCRLLAEDNFKGLGSSNPVIISTPPHPNRPPYEPPKPERTPWDPVGFEDYNFDFEKWKKDFFKSGQRCPICKRELITAPEIANKMCGSCFRKRREERGL